MNFPKRYKIDYIQQLQKEFQEDHPYQADVHSIFVLPAVQTLHLGHFYGLFLKDFFVKTTEMKKKIGCKHGIIFQWKSLLSTSDAQKFFAKREQTLLQVGINKLRKYLYAQKEKGTMINKKLLSLYFGDFIEAFEDHPDFSYFAQTTFRKLWKEGKIYVKKNIAYWSLDLQTTVHHHYVAFKPTQGKKYTIKYFIESRNEMLPTCTRIPDMIFGDVALLVHPWDKRYKKMIGKKAIIPIVNRPIPILADETVDTSKNNGIKRVCPCADKESIALAEKHQLPLDHYVFDREGRYTQYAGEYAGKLRRDFSMNILKYLEDISNLGEVSEEPTTIPYCVHSQEELYPFLMDEIVVDMEKEKAILEQDIQTDPLWEPMKTKLLEALPNFSCVLNRQMPRWTHIPLMKVGGEYRLEEALEFLERKEVDALQSCFDYAVFCLARDQYLTPSFTTDTLFAVFADTFRGIKSYFWELLAEKSKQDKAIASFLELIASLSTAEQADNSEQEANKAKILTLVKNSTCLRNHKEMLQVVLPSGEEVEFLGDTFDNECLAALSPVFLTWYGMKLDTTAFVEEGKTYLFLHELLAQQLLLKKYVYTSLIQYPSLLSDKGERFSYQTVHTSKLFSFLNEHGPSPVRLSLLLEKKLDLQSVQEYDAFLRQIWNGVRYLVTSAQDYRKVTPDQAREVFNTSADDLDRWLIGEVYDLWQRWQKAEGYQALLDMFSDIQWFVQKKLLGWYLEAKKIYLDGERDMTCYLAFSVLLHVLFPFVPGYVRAMLQALDFPTLYEFDFPPTFKKETLVQAAGAYDLFDLLYTLRLKLDIKKHQKIAIFFRADQNSLLLFQEYQDALQKVLNIEQVQLLKLHETEPTGYQQEVYNNITVGIKILPPNPSTKRPVLAELERQYAQQLERFEHLRTVLANMSTYAFIDMETDQIKQKKAELEHVKEQLTQLEKIIQLLKVNNRRR